MVEARYTILLDGFEVTMGLGIHPEERAAPQRVVLGVEMECVYPQAPADRIDAVVDYDFLRDGIRKLVESRHFELQETLCDAVAALAMADPRVKRVRVRSMKVDVYPDARVGCEVERIAGAEPMPTGGPHGEPGVTAFTRRELEAAGFTGWVPLLRAGSGAACPTDGGVYVVLYPRSAPPGFAPNSCGGWFKGKDPGVAASALAANWVEGAETVYIGKADNLRRRLRQFADFGAGKPVGHWGGRLVWQLPAPDALLVAWMTTPGEEPAAVEARLIAAFRAAHGKAPFANDPQRMGR